MYSAVLLFVLYNNSLKILSKDLINEAHKRILKTLQNQWDSTSPEIS